MTQAGSAKAELANVPVHVDDDEGSAQIADKLSLQQKTAIFMMTHPVGIGLEVLTIAMSLISCAMYIAQTYYDGVEMSDVTKKLLRDFDFGDFSLTLYFLLVYVLDAFIAEERMRWALSPLALADFFTVFPPLIFLIPELFFSSSSVAFFGSLNFLRFIRILKILRISRLAKHLAKGESDDVEVQKQLFSVTFMVFSIIFVFAGIFHLIENTLNTPELMEEKWGMNHLQFHDAVYFTVVTVATVGFGDIYPLSVAGKFLVIILIATTIVVISNETNTLFAMLALKSVYARNVYVPPKGSPPHVVICGFVDYTNLSSFLEEFYCDDHGDVEENVIVVTSQLPSVAVEFLLRMPRYRDRLFYLQGSPLSERDLSRARIDVASTVFVLADQFSKDPFSHDSANILLAVSIRSFSVASSLSDQKCIHTILQLIRPESQYHFKNCQSSLLGSYQLLIIDQIRMGIFSKCCHCPGFSTLMSNLVMSMSIESKANMKQWLREYVGGAGWELYRVEMSPFFEGTSFSRCRRAPNDALCDALFFLHTFTSLCNTHASAANIIFSEVGVIIFAIDIHNTSGSTVAVPFPANYIIPIDRVSHVYVIAEDNDSALAVSSYNATTVDPVRRRVEVSVAPSVMSDQLAEDNLAAGFSMKIMAQKFLVRKESAVKPSNFFVSSAASLKDIILVCGVDAGLLDFLKPLRRKTMFCTPNPIVILSRTRPKEWRSLAAFQNVFFVTGSPLEPVDLVRAGVMNAHNAVVLCSSSSQSSNTDHLVDAEAIFTFQGIIKINPKCECVVELVASHSVSYLQSGQVENERLSFSVGVDGSLLSPVYACGTAFVPLVLHRLTCQAYYNKSLLKMLNSFINLDDDEPDSFDRPESILPSELQVIDTFTAFICTALSHTLTAERNSLALLWQQLRGLLSVVPSCREAPRTEAACFSPHSRYVVACPEKEMVLYEGDRAFELKAPSSQVKIFQDIDISSESGRSHVPSEASKPSSSVVSSSINLRKQLLLVMRQLSDDIESVRQDLSFRKSVHLSPTRLPSMDTPLTPSLPGQTHSSRHLSAMSATALPPGSS